MHRLRDAVTALAQSVLPEGTLPTLAVPAVMAGSDMKTVRDGLRGSVVQFQGGIYRSVPAATSALGAGSKKLEFSDSGDPAKATSVMAGADLDGMAPVALLRGVLTDDGGDGELAGGLLVNGLAAVLRPVAADGGLQELSISVMGGPAQQLPIHAVAASLGLEWRPWDGSPALPPQIPAAPGIPTTAAAGPTALPPALILGDGPALAMRGASIQVLGAAFRTCDEAASLVCGMTDTPARRSAVAVAIAAAIAPIPAPPVVEGATLVAVRAAFATFAAELQAAVDSITTVEQTAVIQATASFVGLGLSTSPAVTGGLIHQAAAAAAAARPTTASAAAAAAAALVPAGGGLPPAPTIPPPGPASSAAAIAAAVAAALGTGPQEDPARAEARRLLSGGAPLDPAATEEAVSAVATALRAQGLLPPPGPAPTPPPLFSRAEGAPAPFAALRIAGADALSASEVVQAVATAFGKQAVELTEALGAAVGRAPSAAFFGYDAAYEATRAASAFGIILGGRRFESAPLNWADAGARLRVIMDEPAEVPASAGAAAGARADGVRAGTVKVVSGARRTLAVGGHAYQTSVASLVAAPLTAESVLAAEACAAPELGATGKPDAIGELRRISRTAYADAATAYVTSDGTVHGGNLADKGAPLPPSPTLHCTHAARPPPSARAIAPRAGRGGGGNTPPPSPPMHTPPPPPGHGRPRPTRPPASQRHRCPPTSQTLPSGSQRRPWRPSHAVRRRPSDGDGGTTRPSAGVDGECVAYRPSRAGLISASVDLIRQAVGQWVADELRVIIDGAPSVLTDGTAVPAITRVAGVADDYTLLGKQVVSGVIDYDLLVRLTGGRKPVEGEDDWCAGSWGVSVDDGADTWKQCVPVAMEYTGRILGTLYGEGLGCTLGPFREFDLGPLATRCVQGGLSASNTRLLFIDIFQKVRASGGHAPRRRPVPLITSVPSRPSDSIATSITRERRNRRPSIASPGRARAPPQLAWAMDSRRTGTGRPLPDIPAYVAQAERAKLRPVILKQNADRNASAVAGAAGAAAAAAAIAAAVSKWPALGAGQKRGAPSTTTPTAAAQAAALAAAPGAATGAAAGAPGAPGTRLARRAARKAAYDATKATTAVAVTPALGAPAIAPASPVVANVVQATAAAAAPAAAVAAAGGVAPTPYAWLSGPPAVIARLTDGKSPAGAVIPGAVKAFDEACAAAGLSAAMPCAFVHLRLGGCSGPPGCKRCIAQALLPAPTPPPTSLVDIIKRSCDAATRTRMSP